MSYRRLGLSVCPYCKGPAECGPYIRPVCSASKIGPYDNNPATDEENKLGWYKPGAPVSDQANTVCTFLLCPDGVRREFCDDHQNEGVQA